MCTPSSKIREISTKDQEMKYNRGNTRIAENWITAESMTPTFIFRKRPFKRAPGGISLIVA